jgi:hypothetical protein
MTMPSRFTLTLIDTARANLDSLPEADKDTREVSLREAIRALTPTLRKLERRSYSRQKLVELLAEQNIHISLSSLKGYLGDKVSKRPIGRQPAGQPSHSPAASAQASARPEPRPAAAPVSASTREPREGGNASAANGGGRTATART